MPILIGITVLTFLLMHLSPSDPAERLLTSQGIPVSSDILEEVREEMGLDKPFLTQYGNWMIKIIKGDMGISYMTGRPVYDELASHMPYTVALAAISMVLTLVLAMPLGVLSAVRENRLTDYLVRFLSFVGMSMPGFLTALILIYFVSLKMNLLPVLSQPGIKGILLPSITLAAAMTGKYVRQIRAVVLEEMQKEYVKGARARGIKESRILFFNVLKNSMLSIITLIGLSVGSMLGGTAIVETVFVWPGLGKLVIDAIGCRDYPLIQGYVIWMAVLFVVLNLLTDLTYRLIDPRIRLNKEVA